MNPEDIETDNIKLDEHRKELRDAMLINMNKSKKITTNDVNDINIVFTETSNKINLLSNSILDSDMKPELSDSIVTELNKIDIKVKTLNRLITSTLYELL